MRCTVQGCRPLAAPVYHLVAASHRAPAVSRLMSWSGPRSTPYVMRRQRRVSVLQWSPRDPWHLMVGSDDDASPELQVHTALRVPCDTLVHAAGFVEHSGSSCRSLQLYVALPCQLCRCRPSRVRCHPTLGPCCAAAVGPAQPARAQGDAAWALGRRAGTLVVPAGRGLPAVLRQGQQVRDISEKLGDGNYLLEIRAEVLCTLLACTPIGGPMGGLQEKAGLPCSDSSIAPVINASHGNEQCN